MPPRFYVLMFLGIKRGGRIELRKGRGKEKDLVKKFSQCIIYIEFKNF